MVTPRYHRLHAYVLQRAMGQPNQIGWMIRTEQGWRAISYQLLGASIFAVIRWLQFRESECPNIIVSCKSNGLAWMALDMACASADKLHACVDTRCSCDQIEALKSKIDSTAPFICDADSIRNIPATLNPVHLDDLHVLGLAESILSDSRTQFLEFCFAEIMRCTTKFLSTDQLRMALSSPAQILHTSGTSTLPKLVTLSHGNLICNAIAKLDAMPQFESDLRINLLPFSHAYARTCELSTWAIAGGRLACVPNYSSFVEACDELQPQLVNAVPIIYERLVRDVGLESASSFKSLLGGKLRMLASGGAALNDNLFTLFHQHSHPIHQGYGLTETSPVVCSNRFGHVKSNSIGRPVAGVKLALDKENQLLVSGPGVMLGYWNDSAATALRMRDGWLATGDIAEQNSNGDWKIVGRVDDQITLPNGYKVDPLPIEVLLRQHPKVEDCAIVRSKGKLTCVFITLNAPHPSDALEKEWLRDCLSSLPRHCHPSSLLHVSAQDHRLPTLKTFKGNWNRKQLERFVEENVAELIYL